MKLPGFLNKFSRSAARSQKTDEGLKGLDRLGEFAGETALRLEAAERKALYSEEKIRTLQDEQGLLEKEKQGVQDKLDLQFQQCDSLKQENSTLEERLYAITYKHSGVEELGTNSYEKGQLLTSRQRGADLEHENNWLLPFSDFMMLLLVVFVVFYGLALTDAVKLNDITSAIAKNFRGGEAGVFVEKKRPLMRVSKVSGGNMVVNTQPEAIDDLRNEILSSFKKHNLGENLYVQVNENGVTIRLRDTVAFYPGKSTLMFTSRKMLHGIKLILADYPGRKVLIEGHTDNVPIRSAIFNSNWELSSSRAVSLVRYFVEEEGLPPERFAAVGRAQYQPVASNDTAEGRAANRRVEIKLQLK